MFLQSAEPTELPFNLSIGAFGFNWVNLGIDTTGISDVFANRLLNYGIDTTVIVDVSAANSKKYGVHTVNFWGISKKLF